MAHSEETKLKISMRTKGVPKPRRPDTPEEKIQREQRRQATRRANGFKTKKGYVTTQETREKLAVYRGRTRSEEAKEKTKITKSKKPPYKHTKTIRQKISSGLQGRVFSPEWRAKLSQVRLKTAGNWIELPTSKEEWENIYDEDKSLQEYLESKGFGRNDLDELHMAAQLGTITLDND